MRTVRTIQERQVCCLHTDTPLTWTPVQPVRLVPAPEVAPPQSQGCTGLLLGGCSSDREKRVTAAAAAFFSFRGLQRGASSFSSSDHAGRDHHQLQPTPLSFVCFLRGILVGVRGSEKGTVGPARSVGQKVPDRRGRQWCAVTAFQSVVICIY